MEFVIVALWLVSVAWLVARDAVPRWFAQVPPAPASAAWLEQYGQRFQYGIFGEDSVHKGNAWSVYTSTGGQIVRRDILVLERVQFLERLIIDSELAFVNETDLDEVRVQVKTAQGAIDVQGQRQGPRFAISIKIGPLPIKEVVLDTAAARTLCDVIKPFSALRGLQVGQSWKIHVLNPISLFQGDGQGRLKPVLASVVGQETISIQGRPRQCHIVESPGVRAWVDEAGRVPLQVADIPGLGRLEIREQAFQKDQYEAALNESLRLGRHVHDRNRA